MTGSAQTSDRDDIDRVHRYPVPFPVGSWLVPVFWLLVLFLALFLIAVS